MPDRFILRPNELYQEFLKKRSAVREIVVMKKPRLRITTSYAPPPFKNCVDI